MVNLPDAPSSVLGSLECPTDDILEAIIERAEITRLADPGLALAWADTGIQVAQRLSDVRLARMLAYHAFSMVGVDRLDEAERGFLHAIELLDDSSPADLADVLRMFARLRAVQERLENAFLLAKKAVELSQEHGSDYQRGQALATMGLVRYAQGDYDTAIIEYTLSLRCLDFEVSPTAFYFVCHNLAAATVKARDPRRFGGVFAALEKARKALPPHSTAARAKLKWVEGLLYLRLGNNNRAVSILSLLVRRFEGTEQELAMLLIDLAKAYYELPHLDKTCAALERALELYRSIEGVNPAFVDSIAECLDGLRERTGEYDPWDVRDVVAGEQLAA